MKTLYEFETAFSELMDTALSTLSPEQFDRFKDSVSMILEDYEEQFKRSNCETIRHFTCYIGIQWCAILACCYLPNTVRMVCVNCPIKETL